MAFPTFSRVENPQQFGATVQRLVNMGMHLPDHIVEAGMQWYPTAHDTIAGSGREVDLKPRAAHGIVAAVSPNMDFDNRNVGALRDIRNLDESDWQMIHRSAALVGGKAQKRHPEVAAMLKEKAPSISGAYDTALVKAHRILRGEDPESVLDRRTAPKTHSFFHNLHEPHEYGFVTVDGRHFDIVNNQRLSWTNTNRGIDRAMNVRGGQTRYENIEELTKVATNRIADRDRRYQGALPHDMQAVLWMGGKAIERGGTLEGKGAKRQGQPYTDHRGRPFGFNW